MTTILLVYPIFPHSCKPVISSAGQKENIPLKCSQKHQTASARCMCAPIIRHLTYAITDSPCLGCCCGSCHLLKGKHQESFENGEI